MVRRKAEAFSSALGTGCGLVNDGMMLDDGVVLIEMIPERTHTIPLNVAYQANIQILSCFEEHFKGPSHSVIYGRSSIV